MDKMDQNIIQLLEYIQDTIDSSPKVPMSNRVMVDKKDIMETIDQIVHYLPDQLKKAEWVMNERERILAEAKKEYDDLKKETMVMMRQNVENHDFVKEAKLRAKEIIASAERDAKIIRLGSRDYSNEMLAQLDDEIESQKTALIEKLQNSFEIAAKEIDKSLSSAGNDIKENIKELRNMKK